ncbi:MAG: hypothetical protein IIC07_05875, partial [Proteobacteria bacterium]|nr:hypothetical protein [Pseudomonadota bacterium]
HLEPALELYRGPFLEGEFDPPEFLTARERYHSIFLRHIKTLGEHFKDQGNSRRAMELYQRGLEIDPLAEEFYAALMRTHLELAVCRT